MHKVLGGIDDMGSFNVAEVSSPDLDAWLSFPRGLPDFRTNVLSFPVTIRPDK